MTKLKTLKEICKEFWTDPEGSTREEGNNGTATGQYVYARVRKEAIKWIKEHDWIFDVENDKWYNVPESLQLTHADDEFQAICDWIKHFFNITEEDLKNG